MRLDFSNFWQLQTLGYSLAVGVLLCLIYDIVRIFNRTVRPGTAVLFIIDIVYWALVAVVTFCFFMLFSKGSIRFYAYIGFVAGFLICRATLSKLFMYLLGKLILGADFLYGVVFKAHKKMMKIAVNSFAKFKILLNPLKKAIKFKKISKKL